MEQEKSNLYLVGMMGAGKTTVGRLLAKRLHRKFVDADLEIEARTGVRISVIFELEGEEGFRQREVQTIADLTQRRNLVVATGGGAVMRQENRERMAASGTVVYLRVPPNVLFERTRHDRNRPLLHVDDPLRKLEELYVLRDPLYMEIAHVVIDGSSTSVQGLARRVEQELSNR